MLTQSGALGHVIGWFNFSHWQIVHRFPTFSMFIVSSCYSVLEFYNLFSGIKYYCVIIMNTKQELQI